MKKLTEGSWLIPEYYGANHVLCFFPEASLLHSKAVVCTGQSQLGPLASHTIIGNIEFVITSSPEMSLVKLRFRHPALRTKLKLTENGLTRRVRALQRGKQVTPPEKEGCAAF